MPAARDQDGIQDDRAQSSSMKVTTVRFGADLWALLEVEAARAGVSVAQYIREAALARAAFAAGARAGAPAELLQQWAATTLDPEIREPTRIATAQNVISALTRSISRAEVDEAIALRGESAQTVRQSTRVLERSRRNRSG